MIRKSASLFFSDNVLLFPANYYFRLKAMLFVGGVSVFIEFTEICFFKNDYHI